MISLNEFANENGITMVARRIGARPDRKPTRWDETASHWLCEFTRRPASGARVKRMTVYYSQGSAHRSVPSLADVLGSVARDCGDFHADPAIEFEDWAESLGYDPDSLSTYRTFEACRASYRDLKQFLGTATALRFLFNGVDLD